MKKNIIVSFIALMITLSMSCGLEMEHTTHRISITNESSYILKVHFKTIEKEEKITLTNNMPSINSFKEIHENLRNFEVMKKYTDAEFREQIEGIWISIVTSTGEIVPLSKNFAENDNWKHTEGADDQIILHFYNLALTDDLLDK